MRKGTDRATRLIPGGTRHPCPYCDWFLDMEPVPMFVPSLTPRDWGIQFNTLLDAVGRRLETIEKAMVNHIKTDHPNEYAEAVALAGEGLR